MDNTSTARDGQPPKKKRRVAAPLFKSAFDTDSPAKQRRSAGPQKSFTDAFQDFNNAFDPVPKSASKLLPITPKGPRVVSIRSGLGASTTGVTSPSAQNLAESFHHKDKRLKETFSDFAAVFDLPTLAPKPTVRPTKNTSKLSLNVSRSSSTSNYMVDGVPLSGTSAVTHTPLRLLKPPSLKEGGKETTSSKNDISALSSNFQNNISIPDTKGKGKAKLTSMTSHLFHLQNSASSHSPEKASGQEKKLVPLAPPIFKADSSALSNTDSPVIGNSTISFTQRATILTHSVLDQFKNETANIELSKFARGMYTSPQKGNKEYGQKLLRGGLAERAENIISRAQTSFTLWQAAIIKQLEGSHQPKEDLRLRILSVLGYTKQPGKPSVAAGPPRSAIARCREVLEDISEEGAQPQEGTVVFLFAMHEKVSSAANFGEGKDVCVWRPWQEIDMPDSPDPFTMLPIEMRSPPSSQSLDSLRRTALLCSRFLVLN